MRTLFAVLFFATLLAACSSNDPQEGSPTAEDGGAKTQPDERMVGAVKSRKAVLTVLKDNFVPLALMANGRIDYDAGAAQRFADRLPVMFGMMEERFATDTRGSGVETEALDNIWEDMDAFKGKISNALDAANTLAAAASDETQFEDAAMAVRSACGSCHDDFRVDTD